MVTAGPAWPLRRERLLLGVDWAFGQPSCSRRVALGREPLLPRLHPAGAGRPLGCGWPAPAMTGFAAHWDQRIHGRGRRVGFAFRPISLASANPFSQASPMSSTRSLGIRSSWRASSSVASMVVALARQPELGARSGWTKRVVMETRKEAADPQRSPLWRGSLDGTVSSMPSSRISSTVVPSSMA